MITHIYIYICISYCYQDGGVTTFIPQERPQSSLPAQVRMPQAVYVSMILLVLLLTFVISIIMNMIIHMCILIYMFAGAAAASKQKTFTHLLCCLFGFVVFVFCCLVLCLFVAVCFDCLKENTTTTTKYSTKVRNTGHKCNATTYRHY